MQKFKLILIAENIFDSTRINLAINDSSLDEYIVQNNNNPIACIVNHPFLHTDKKLELIDKYL